MNFELNKLQQQEIQHQLDKISKAIKKEAHQSFWSSLFHKIAKPLEIIGASVATGIAAMTGNPVVAVLMLSMIVSQETGLTKAVTDDLAKALEASPGFGKLLGKEGAQILAAITVTLLIVAITGAAAPSSVAEEGAEGAAKSWNPMTKLSVRTNLMLVNGLQAIQQTNFINTLPVSDKVKEGLGIGLSVISMLASLLASGAVSSKMANEGAPSGLFKKLSELTKGTKLIPYLERSRQGIAAIAGLVEIAQGGINVSMATIEQDLAKYNGDLTILQSALQMLNDTTVSDQKQQADMFSHQSTGNRSLAKLADGERELAKILTTASPV